MEKHTNQGLLSNYSSYFLIMTTQVNIAVVISKETRCYVPWTELLIKNDLESVSLIKWEYFNDIFLTKITL